MVNLAEILVLIDEHIARTGETMTELSRRATGSTETIRNWRRRIEKGEEPSASFHNVQAILRAMDVQLHWTSDGERTVKPEVTPIQPGMGAPARGPTSREELSVELADLFAELLRAKTDVQAQVAGYIKGRLRANQPKSRDTATKHAR